MTAMKNVLEPEQGNGIAIVEAEPYRVFVEITGSADLILHRWNCEGVANKSKAKKNSVEKKTDDLESFVYRDEDGRVAIPGEYLRQSIINAAKYKSDPRSPRKSMMDLMKAAFIVNEKYCSLGVKKWDYVDTRRVVIQRAGINRSRPAFHVGWKISATIEIILPEYLDEYLLHEIIQLAGRVVGIADFRPSYGRFNVTGYERLS